ncbi:hypothetical protein [Candidatus Enterovibrio escicola]|uniref:hypothetical protein n=1 Tax=Candidatus Enterovibrio escicola TaxID=1927127 RepID=UPI000BE467DB|nr:hypothetical protein [Candidatus Enterovibrio escacola]
MSTSRIKCQDEYTSIASSFLAIKRKQTGHDPMPFATERTEKTGHADSFFTIPPRSGMQRIKRNPAAHINDTRRFIMAKENSINVKKSCWS